MGSLIDIYLYIYCTYRDWHSWTEDDRSCDAGDRDSLLSSRKWGKDWRRREWLRGRLPLLPLTPSHTALSLPRSPPLPLPVLPPPPSRPPPQRCTLAWNRGGSTHTQVCVSVCLSIWTCETAEQSRSVKQTDMHVRLPRIEHPGTPLLSFLFNSYFLTVFFITVIFSYLSILVLSAKNHTKRSPFSFSLFSFSLSFFPRT